MSFPTDPERAIKIEVLVKVLADLPFDSIVTYTALGDAISESLAPGSKERIILLRARERVEKETGHRFEALRGTGLKKLSGASVSGIGVAARRKIARKAAKESHRLETAAYNLSPEDAARVNAERSLLGAIHVAAKADINKVQAMTVTGPKVAEQIFDLLTGKKEKEKE